MRLPFVQRFRVFVRAEAPFRALGPALPPPLTSFDGLRRENTVGVLRSYFAGSAAFARYIADEVRRHLWPCTIHVNGGTEAQTGTTAVL